MEQKIKLTERQLKLISDRTGVGLELMRDAALAFSSKTTSSTSTAVGLSCAKCGLMDIMTKFHQSKYACGRSTGTWSGTSYTFEGEHLHRTCRDCGYQWQSLPLDASTKASVERTGEFLEPDVSEPKVK